ncbi:MAG: leucine-rich repeat protein [Bacteroidaceae bacterium]|nr:leucine-rich repeat protein [Bacteroidaceae bacterium]
MRALRHLRDYEILSHSKSRASPSVRNAESVTSIKEFRFAGCIGLTSVVISKSVMKIETWAFKGCTGLTSITCLSTVPPDLVYNPNMGSKPFFDTNNCPIYVPAESVDRYKTE